MPLPEAYVTTIRCHYSMPRPGGTTRKYRTYTRFLVLRPLSIGTAFQRACLDRRRGGKAPLDLGRLLGEEGALTVSPQGLLLEPGQNYAPRGVVELQAIVVLLRQLLRNV